jgi:hypothetical protein
LKKLVEKRIILVTGQMKKNRVMSLIIYAATKAAEANSVFNYLSVHLNNVRPVYQHL